jgi:hypothetical protein
MRGPRMVPDDRDRWVRGRVGRDQTMRMLGRIGNRVVFRILRDQRLEK